MALDIREDYVAFPPHMRYIGQTTGAPRHLVWDTIVHIAKDLMVTHSTDSRPVTSKDTRMDKDDGNYTGATGVAVALINLVIHAKRSAYITVLIQQNLAYTIDDAERLAQRIAYGAYDSAVAKVLNDPRRAITTGGAGWYCGFPGVIATMVKVAGVSGDTTRAAQGIVTLLQLAPVVASAAGGVANEILYGRAGYLTCLREVATCGVNVPSEINGAATLVINAIMADGRAKATSSWPLLWDFHGTTYLGAAHGVGGILHELLFWWDLISAIDRAAIVATLRQLARVCRDKAPAALDRHGEVPRNEEEIVHWCHGPGGLCAVFAKAATVLDDAALEESARLLGRRVTEKGILRKGMGLCHGVCGNAYALLALYRATGDHRYLHESVAMIEVGLSEECQTRAIATYRDPQRLVVGKPDTPLSLMEGDAGVLCCLLDILDPQLSAFPGFETTATAQPLHWLSWAQCPIDHPKPEPPQVVPGVWEVDLMDPSFCETFLQDVYSCFPAEKRKVDALRLGRRHEAVVRAITAVVQRFVHNVMVPADARRIKRFTSTTEDASPVDDEAGTDDEDTEDATDDEAPVPNAPNAEPKRKPLTAFERENLQKTREAQKYRDSALMSIEMPQLRVWRAYIIRYDAINHPSINSHNDACDVTFNLCMKRTAEKGHLVFNESAYVHQHRPGTATIFWGDKVHHTHNVEGDGERAQLVLLLNFMRPDALGTPLRALEARGLNDPCLFEILLFLPVRDIASFSYANKRFYQVANESGLWYQLYRRNASLMHFRDTESLLVVPWCVNCKTVRGSEACASCHQPICTECFAINHANTCRACIESQSAHRRDVQWYELSYSWKVPEYVEGVSHWKQVYHAALVQANLAEPIVARLRTARGSRPWMVATGVSFPDSERSRAYLRQLRMLQFGGPKFDICPECRDKDEDDDDVFWYDDEIDDT